MEQTSFFDRLLAAAAGQSQPQRLLFVFAGAELPADATTAQRASHAAGHGGTLTPLICVDKAPEALTTFAALCAEAAEAGPPWQIVFIAAIGGRDGRAPSDQVIESTLETLVKRVRAGALDGLLALDRSGATVQLCAA